MILASISDSVQIVIFLLFILASCHVALIITRLSTEPRPIPILVLSPVIVFVILLILVAIFSEGRL